MKTPELLALLIYFVLVIGVGVYFFFKGRKDGGAEKEYFLGGRNMGGWVSALSAGASDMSAWVLMGLPGSIYLYGMGKVWIAIGLFIGTTTAWLFVAPQLRRYSIVANDSITIPQFLTNRFKTERKGILILSAIVFMIAYCVYAASSIFACGKLFNTVLGMNPMIAMVIATVVIVVYTFLGGFNAVCWTDFFQGLLMLGALMLAPILAVMMMESASFVKQTVDLGSSYYNFYSTGTCDWKSIADIISGLGWGLGYFGMPHIIIRYIAIKSEKEMRKSQIIGITWFFFILIAAAAVGLIGRRFLGDSLKVSGQQEMVFIEMVRSVFDWLGNNIGMASLFIFFAGILLSAILAASMSTADSQLLASSSAFASDIYKPLFRSKASDNEMMWAGRIVVLVIAGIAFAIAANPKCQSIMALVECAWAAFGSAFGPAILFALYWKRLNYSGALAGILVGFSVNVVWHIMALHLEVFPFFERCADIYEIVPGFICGSIAIVVVSLLTKKPSDEILSVYEKAHHPID